MDHVAEEPKPYAQSGTAAVVLAAAGLAIDVGASH